MPLSLRDHQPTPALVPSDPFPTKSLWFPVLSPNLTLVILHPTTTSPYLPLEKVITGSCISFLWSLFYFSAHSYLVLPLAHLWTFSYGLNPPGIPLLKHSSRLFTTSGTYTLELVGKVYDRRLYHDCIYYKVSSILLLIFGTVELHWLFSPLDEFSCCLVATWVWVPVVKAGCNYIRKYDCKLLRV